LGICGLATFGFVDGFLGPAGTTFLGLPLGFGYIFLGIYPPYGATVTTLYCKSSVAAPSNVTVRVVLDMLAVFMKSVVESLILAKGYAPTITELTGTVAVPDVPELATSTVDTK
jgi:hypothetical protein